MPEVIHVTRVTKRSPLGFHQESSNHFGGNNPIFLSLISRRRFHHYNFICYILHKLLYEDVRVVRSWWHWGFIFTDNLLHAFVQIFPGAVGRLFECTAGFQYASQSGDERHSDVQLTS